MLGFGASSIVYAATFQPPDSEKPLDCALKVLDLDRLPQHALRLLERETQLMSISKHPNVLRVRGSWMAGHKLYIAMRLMNSGSASDVMRYGWPGGMEEDVVRAILKQALEGLKCVGFCNTFLQPTHIWLAISILTGSSIETSNRPTCFWIETELSCWAISVSPRFCGIQMILRFQARPPTIGGWSPLNLLWFKTVHQ